MKKQKVLTQIVVLVIIVVVINLILNQLYFRIDFTADQRYTLSKATREVLQEVEDVITITAYFSEELPPQLMSSRQDFQDMLIEYEKRSGGNIVYRFVNPNENEEAETEAQEKGIRPVIVNVTERDQVKQLRAYMGAVLSQGEETEVIPVIQPGSGIEYSLTTSVKKMVARDKPRVAFLQGHGEPSPQASAQVVDQLSVLYEVEPYSINDTSDIPGSFRAVAIINPSDTFPSSHLQKLDKFMRQGGGIFLAYNNLQGDLSQGYLSSGPDIGLKSWLQKKGINLNNEFVIDVNCGAVSVRQQLGPFPITTQIEFPYFPIVSNFGEHPSTNGLESVILPFVSAITYQPLDSAVSITPVASTSEQSGLIPAPVMVDINREWTENDFNAGPQVVAVTLTGPVGGSGDAKMAVITNGSFAVNGEGQQVQQVNPDNVNLVTNLIDWLSDDTGLIDLRTKAITSRPLDPLEESTKALLKYGNVLLPIVLLLAFAFYRRQRSARKRQNWIQGNF